MIPSSVKKHFIAGAVCPKCQLIDKIVVYTIVNKKFAECIRCGHKQEADFANDTEQSQKEKKQKVFWLKQH